MDLLRNLWYFLEDENELFSDEEIMLDSSDEFEDEITIDDCWLLKIFNYDRWGLYFYCWVFRGRYNIYDKSMLDYTQTGFLNR